jgi:hypothetical protein
VTQPEEDADDPLGLVPTPYEGRSFGPGDPWDDATRPHREPPPDARYTRRGRLVGEHLIEVHDMLRGELAELREVLAEVAAGARSAGAARAALHDMALRRNDWTLGAFCARYCAVVTQHHGLEDAAVFPHLARSEPALEPVIDRLAQEHLAIHDAIQALDSALVAHIADPTDLEEVEAAVELLGEALLSHLSYEEHELVEPLARHGFYPGQL